MPKITSSSDRSKRSTKKPVTQGQNPQRANRQQTSRATVTNSQQRSNRMRASQARGTTQVTSSGARASAPGTKGATANATPTGPRNPQSQVASARMRNTLRGAAAGRAAAQTASMQRSARNMLTPINIAYETLKARPLADGTLKGKATGATQGPAVPKRLTQSGINKGSFDDAFRNARKAKMKEFTWRGKRYNTKLKGE